MAHIIIIRDPIHNYIAISQLESLLTDHPLFQRLRYISQNGLAHLVYPSNRTSRFIHSLGAMHLSGQFVLRGLANAERDDVHLFWTNARRLINDARNQINTNNKEVIQHLKNSDDAYYRESGFDPTREDDVDKIVLLQAIRLAAVMHDLGHLPFSHTLEHVLMDSRRPTTTNDSDERRAFEATFDRLRDAVDGPVDAALHELIGKALMRLIFKGLPTGGHLYFALLCFRIASDIVHYKEKTPDRYGVLASLHSIISGDIDADRFDYVRRDGYASGFEFGDFDLLRILSSIRFRFLDGSFALIPTTVSTSALESFFLERYRIYRWLVFHPMVQRVDLALSRAFTILLEVWFHEVRDRDAERVRRRLEHWKFSRLWEAFDQEETYEEYVTHDENWLLALLRDIQREVRVIDTTQDLRVLALKVYLDLICDRRKEHLTPLWKRQEHYQIFATHVAKCFSSQHLPPEWKRRDEKDDTADENTNRISRSRENDVAWCNRVFGLAIDAQVAARGSRIAVLRDFETEIQTRLTGRGWEGGIVATQLRFSPYKTLPVIDTRAANREVPLEELSTIVASLETMWSQDMQFRPYWFERRRTASGYSLAPRTEGHGPALADFASAFGETLLAMLEAPTAPSS